MEFRIRDPDQGLLGPIRHETVVELLQAGVFGPEVRVSLDGGPFVRPSELKELANIVGDAEIDPDRPRYAGDLARVTAFKILFRLSSTGEAGCLTFRDGERIKQVYFDANAPTYIASNLKEERIGAYLQRQGVISQEVRKEAGERLRDHPDLDLGQVLIALDAIDRQSFAQHLQNCQIERVVELCQWRTGRYAFYAGRRYDGKRYAASWDLHEVLLKAARTFEAEKLQFRMRPFMQSEIHAQPHPLWKQGIFELNDAELKVADALTHKPTLRAAAEVLGDSQPARAIALSVIYLLWEIDAIVFR